MANKFDGDFTGFDAVSFDRFQTERDYEDSLDAAFGDFEGGQVFNREDFMFGDEEGDMMQDDFESDFEPEIDDDFPMYMEYEDDSFFPEPYDEYY